MNVTTEKIERFQAALRVLNGVYQPINYKNLTQEPYELYNESVEYIDKVRFGLREGLTDTDSRIRAINQMWDYHQIKFRGLL